MMFLERGDEACLQICRRHPRDKVDHPMRVVQMLRCRHGTLAFDSKEQHRVMEYYEVVDGPLM